MAKYKRIVTTEAGLSLLAKAYEREMTITFTAVKTGNGTYTGTENLSKTTKLKSVKQSFGLSGVSRTGAQVKARSVINNNGVTTGYDITEIGLYAKDTDSTEILYAIIVAESGNEDYLPPFEETPTSITLEMYIAIAEEQSSVKFAAEVVAGTFVAVGDFQDHAADETHITPDERENWNAKADLDDFQSHVSSTVHITAAERTSWNAKVSTGDLQTHASNATHITSDERNSWNAKAPASDLQSHASNSTHITATERESWNAKAAASDLQAHTASTSNPHGVTKSQVGLGNVPNVATNDQTPTYTEASANAALTSGEKLSVAFGKIAKAVSSLISHLADSGSHITATERTAWNNKANQTSVDNIVNGTTVVGNSHLVNGYEEWQIRNVDENGVPINNFLFSQYAPVTNTFHLRPSQAGIGTSVDKAADADTVDGYHANNFVLLSDYLVRLVGITEALDFNSLTTTNTYAFNLSSIELSTNAPVKLNGMLYVVKGGIYIQQEFVTMSNDVYRRSCNNGTWNAWQYISSGGSAPVVISATAPTNTGVAWIDTTNMKLKIYKNGSWTALS